MNENLCIGESNVPKRLTKEVEDLVMGAFDVYDRVISSASVHR